MEAQPLGPGDMQYVFEALRGCLSQDVGTQKQAEAALHALEVKPGFCSCLAEIIANKDADHSARWLATVQLKNSTNKYWRSRLAGSLGEKEKAHLRQKLLLLIDQDDNRFAVQLAVVVAKIARLDFPRAWPSLFSDLLGRLQAATGTQGAESTLTVRRVYLALHHILKELASKRLAADQRNFEAITAQLLEPLWQQWSQDTQSLITNLPAALAGPASAPGGTPAMHAMQQLLVTFERWLLQLKAVRRMLLFGFPSDAKSLTPVDAVARAVPEMLGMMQQMDGIRVAGKAGPGGRSQLAAMLDRGVLKLLKSLRQIQEVHPWSVLQCGALVPSLEFCCGKILQAPAVGPPSTADFSIQCLLLVHAVQRCPSYKGSPSTLVLSAGSGREQMKKLKEMAGNAAAPVLNGFWSPARLEALLLSLVERLLPLTGKDLESWKDDAETFHLEQESLTWEESLRGCAENVYLALFEGHREMVAPMIIGLLGKAQASCPAGAAAALSSQPSTPKTQGIPNAVLAKEAVYTAAATGSYELHDDIDFSAWLSHGGLLQEIHDPSPANKPLRRRAMMLIGRWAAKLKKPERPAIYQALVEALNDEDFAIRLAAVVALRTLIDDWEFDEAQFLQFVGPCFGLLTKMLESAGELESQSEVFNLVNLVIDRLGEGIKPYAPGLMALMPGVWQASEGQSLLRIQVLVALQRLVHALGPESPMTYPIVLPVLRLCTDPNQPDELNLLEDGMHLWLVALRNAPACDDGLLAPFPNLLTTMQRSTEHIAIGMKLATSCILLGGAQLLRAHGQGLVGVLKGYIGNVKDRGMMALLPVMDVVVQTFPEEGPSLLTPALTALLADILAGREQGTVIAASLGIFARVLVHNPSAFIRLCTEAAPHVVSLLPPSNQDLSHNTNLNENSNVHGNNNSSASSTTDPTQRLILALTDLWLDRFDHIGALPARKLSALALCTLLTAPLPQILSSFDTFVAHITSVWFEVEGSGPDAFNALDFYAGMTPRDDDIHAAVNSEDAAGECSRRKALWERDPVARVKLSEWCKGKVGEASGVHGGEVLQEIFKRLDPTLAGQFQTMLA